MLSSSRGLISRSYRKSRCRSMKYYKKQLAVLLQALLFAGCVKSSQPKTIVIPPTPCVVPPTPLPRAKIESIRDCDGTGLGTDICLAEEDLVTIYIFLKMLAEHDALLMACPSVQVLEAHPSESEPVFHDERSQL